MANLWAILTRISMSSSLLITRLPARLAAMVSTNPPMPTSNMIRTSGSVTPGSSLGLTKSRKSSTTAAIVLLCSDSSNSLPPWSPKKIWALPGFWST